MSRIAPPVDREITLRDYGRVLWSGRVVILVCILVAVVAGLALSFARTTQYTATARVSLGQATTTAGVPVQTPLTNPTTAPQALSTDEIVERVAREVNVPPGRVRDAVTLTAPRVTGSAGNLPTLLTITAQDRSRRVAIDVANAYGEQVLARVGEDFEATRSAYSTQLRSSREAVTQLTRDVRQLRGQLVAAAGTDRAVALQTALLSAQDQLRSARQDVQAQTIQLAKADQVEAPYAVAIADSASSSGSAPQRVRSALLAGLIGLLIGVLAVFVWKGSPAARAAGEAA